MKIRIKFRKYGTMKFIGHLDTMRYFQKAMRRAEIDIAYSEGYSPHQIMSFAAPLGVGITSDGEYLDIEVHETMDSQAAIKALNDTMAEGVEVISYVKLPDTAKNAMSVVACADYELFFKEGYEIPATVEQFCEIVKNEFTDKDEFMVVKKTKKSETSLNLKELVYDFKVCESEENQPVFYLKLSTGSEKNIKPELVLSAVFERAGLVYNPYAIQIHRKDVYFRNEAGEYETLDQAGEIIEERTCNC